MPKTGLEKTRYNGQNIYQIASKILQRHFRARPHISGSDWADTYRMIAPGTSPEPGRWHTDRVPYMREPLDMATAHSVERLVIMSAAQVAKSELLLNTMFYFMDQEPSTIMMLQPTKDLAAKFSVERISPSIAATPVIADKMIKPVTSGATTSRKSADTILAKTFHGGFLALVGTNAPGDLASRPVRVVLCDEVDRFSRTKEGDPIELVEARTKNFSNRKLIFVSTPTYEHRDNGPTIFELFQDTDQREFLVKCPHCGERLRLEWSNVRWDKDAYNNVIVDSIRMDCPHCGKKIRGGGKIDPYLLESGVWVPQKPQNRHPGYHLTALCSPWVELAPLVLKWHKITNDRDKSRQMEFVNLQLGEPWHEEDYEADLWDHLSKRREFYPPEGLPRGILALTCGVDVQRDRLEATLWGWGTGFESWCVCHRVIFGDPHLPQVWADLDAFLLEKQRTEDGRTLISRCTFVDSGDGETVEDVYSYCYKHQRANIYPIKGKGDPARPIVDRPTKSNRYKINLFTLGVDSGKSLIMQRLNVEDLGPGFVHFPRGTDNGIDENYFKQLTAEYLQKRYTQGRYTEKWVKRFERNEALDCFVYATAAIILLHPNFELLEKMAQAGSPDASEAKPIKKKKKSCVVSGGIA